MKKRLTSLLLVFMLVFAMLPVQTVLAADAPQDGSALELTESEAPGEADGTAEESEPAGWPVIPVPEEGTDIDGSAAMPALGSNGVQYADVAYLSAAAYNSMSADTQAVYMQVADEVSALIEAGIEVSDVVFSLNEDGTLGFTCFIPMEVLDTGLDIDLPEYGGGSDPIGTPDAEEPKTPIAENVELAESVAVPVETFESVPLEESMAILSDVIEDGDDLAELDTLFWTNKNYFYNQLSTYAKDYYNAGYKAMVQGKAGTNSFTTTSRGYSITYVVDGVSALINTYPQKFDWRGSGGISCGGSYSSSGVYTIKATMTKSSYYSASLEKSAQSQVNKLVTNAYNYAKNNYPNSITYGIVRYFDEWLCANNYYNMTGTYESAKSTSTYYYCHSSYGALLKGYAVCESYALAMSRLLDAAGIPNLYVVGDAGGGHAWNYVQMPNTYWYLQDTTWNDTTSPSHNYSSRTYLLCKNDTTHQPTGKAYVSGNTFSYPTRSTSNYSSYTTETIRLNKTSLALSKGKSETLSLSTTYYDSYTKTWSSSNTSVATVDQNGKVTAKSAGTATITVTIAGKTASCNVIVYEISGLGFAANNNKTSYTDTYGVTGSFGSSSKTYTLNVLQKTNSGVSASSMGLAAPTYTNSKPDVASVSVSLSGNTISLKVTPKKVGSTSIKVTFAGKTATLTLKVTKGLESSWFNLSQTSYTYTGSAIKPTVNKTGSVPSDVKYTVKYSNNTNAGTGTVTITGSGNYGGTVTKTFTISKVTINSSTIVSISAPKATTYTGKANPATVTVKVTVNGKTKTLKAGTDYDIYYNNSSYTAPTNAGTYALQILGKGNYNGGCFISDRYTINKAAISKMKVTASSSVKYTGSAVNAATLKLSVKIGSVALTSGYKVTYRDANGNTIPAPSAKGTYYVVVTSTGGNFTGAAKTPDLLEVTKKFTIK